MSVPVLRFAVLVPVLIAVLIFGHRGHRDEAIPFPVSSRQN
jgi:hypothetical protein